MFLLLSRSTTSRRTSQQGGLDPPGSSSFAGTLVPMSHMVCPRLAFTPIPLHGLCAAPCRAEDSSQHTAPSWSLPCIVLVWMQSEMKHFIHFYTGSLAIIIWKSWISLCIAPRTGPSANAFRVPSCASV